MKSLALIATSIIVFTHCWFDDMAHSPSVDAQQQDERSGRIGNMQPPEGAIAYGEEPYPLGNQQADFDRANKVLKSPFKKLDSAGLKRGQQQYGIYCQPCHGELGKGDGPIKAKMAAIRPVVGNSAEVPPMKWSTAEIYHVISVGIRSMSAYSSQMSEENRWYAAHYVKYLQGKK